MKNLSLILLIVCLFAFADLHAQEVLETSRSLMRKTSGNALSVVLQGQPKNVETVLDQKFKAGSGTKGKKSKGMTAYEGVVYRDISSSSMDYYYKVEKASKNDDIHTRVSLFISAGNNNFVDSSTNPEEIKAAKKMLKGLETEVKKYEFKVAIEEQTKLIAKTKKEYDKMVNDSVKLETKLAETIQAIEENKVNRFSQLVKISEEENRLEEFRTELGKLESGVEIKKDN